MTATTQQRDTQRDALITAAHDAYRAAVVADEAYSVAIRRAFGRRATRWTISDEDKVGDPAVEYARRDKVAADRRCAEATRQLQQYNTQRACLLHCLHRYYRTVRQLSMANAERSAVATFARLVGVR